MRAEVAFIWNEQEIRDWQWPVVVEMYPKIRTCGSVRRKFEQAFTEDERGRIADLYREFRNWYLVTGAPSEHRCRPETVSLIKRAVALFATA